MLHHDLMLHKVHVVNVPGDQTDRQAVVHDQDQNSDVSGNAMCHGNDERTKVPEVYNVKHLDSRDCLDLE